MCRSWCHPFQAKFHWFTGETSPVLCQLSISSPISRMAATDFIFHLISSLKFTKQLSNVERSTRDEAYFEVISSFNTFNISGIGARRAISLALLTSARSEKRDNWHHLSPENSPATYWHWAMQRRVRLIRKWWPVISMSISSKPRTLSINASADVTGWQGMVIIHILIDVAITIFSQGSRSSCFLYLVNTACSKVSKVKLCNWNSHVAWHVLYRPL